ncbi:tRNA dimethylallyltransferase [Synergistales bacterium]|nr:tRNA dimethylallyltransferase [Synergistales bacterium]
MKVVAIIGPTAVGKTALSLELASRLGAEIVSVDSRQVYRYMNVGTDKVSIETRREIPHHLIDVCDPDETFTVADFVESAVPIARGIADRGRVPLFVGGTPFYYDALFRGALSDGLPHDRVIRERFERAAETEGAEALHKRLREVDEATAARLHPNDVRRVSRALEIYTLTGTAPSSLYENQNKKTSDMDVFYIGLTRPRATLHENITARVKQQFSSGYPEEVLWLMEHGYDERYPSMQGFGYIELAAWARGTMTLEEAELGDVRRTKAFCRRQFTWFGKFPDVLWFDLSVKGVQDALSDMGEAIERHLQQTKL